MTRDGAAAVPAEEAGAVAAVFGGRESLALRFAEHLRTSGVERGLIGPREVPRLWSRHILNCAVVESLIAPDESLVDVGSGAGLPGMVLAIARPDLSVVLVEPLLRRVVWLAEVQEDLGLERVEVVRGRAESLAGSVRTDVVVARAVAPLDVLAGWCLPLLEPGGRLLALKGRAAREELAAAVPALERLGAEGWRVRQCGEGLLAEPTTVVEVVAGASVLGTDGAGARGAGWRAGARERAGRGSHSGGRRRRRRD